MQQSPFALALLLALPLPLLAQNPLKLKQIQIIGTHNSYHAGIAPNESKIWQAKYAEAYKGLDYQHPPLPVHGLCPQRARPLRSPL